MAILTYVFDVKELEKRLRVTLMKPAGMVEVDLQRRAENVRDRARVLLLARSSDASGVLAASIHMSRVRRAAFDQLVAQVGSDKDYAGWVEEGTGVFGPHGTPIVPTHASFLRFEPRRRRPALEVTGRGLSKPIRRRNRLTFIRVRSVQGQPGKHYLRDALTAVLQ